MNRKRKNYRRRSSRSSRRHGKNSAQNNRDRTTFLVVRARNGDGLAFDALQRQYAKTLQDRIAAGVFPRLHGKQLKHVVQDAWALIRKHLAEYDPSKESFTAFAKRWAHIALLQWLERHGRIDLFVAALMEHFRRYPGMRSDEIVQLENRIHDRYSTVVRNRIAAGIFPWLHGRHLEDVCHDAWALIWKKLPRYNPSKASFAAFARFWAGIALLRWLARRRHIDLLLDGLTEHGRRYGVESNEMDLIPVFPFNERWDLEALAAKVDKAIGQLLRTSSDPLEILSVLLTMFAEWPPRVIAAKLSRKTLRAVTNLVARLVRRETRLSKEQMNGHFATLRKLLRERVENVFRGRRHARLRQRHRGARVGDLRVRDYYTGTVKGGPPAEIVKWRAAAVARLRP